MSLKGKVKVPGSPDEWMNHATSDMRLAHLAASDEFVRREQVCFHAQQAAEKAIKAVLLSRGVDFPLTHDIEELLEIAESSGMELAEEIQEASILTPYAVETRYPGYWFEITEADLKEAMHTAEIVIAWADDVLKKPREADS